MTVVRTLHTSGHQGQADLGRRTEGFFLPGLVPGLLRGPWEFAMHHVLVAVAARLPFHAGQGRFEVFSLQAATGDGRQLPDAQALGLVMLDIVVPLPAAPAVGQAQDPRAQAGDQPVGQEQEVAAVGARGQQPHAHLLKENLLRCGRTRRLRSMRAPRGQRVSGRLFRQIAANPIQQRIAQSHAYALKPRQVG